METSSPSVSHLLQRWSAGDSAALDQLLPLVYGELHRMARRYMEQQPTGHTLQTTALIHEAYLRLVGQEEVRWENRAHFFGVAAQAMRHILLDYARARDRRPNAEARRAPSRWKKLRLFLTSGRRSWWRWMKRSPNSPGLRPDSAR